MVNGNLEFKILQISILFERQQRLAQSVGQYSPQHAQECSKRLKNDFFKAMLLLVVVAKQVTFEDLLLVATYSEGDSIKESAHAFNKYF